MSEPEHTMTPEEQATMVKYLQEVKRELKSKSKNDLIRMIGALLVDQHVLRGMLEVYMPKDQPPTDEAKNA